MEFEEMFKSWTLEQKVEWALGPNICNLSENMRSIIVDLQAENERLKRELKQMEVQDQVVIDTLRNENERLKKILDFEKSQAEGWRDRAEQLEHENHPEHFDCVDHIPHESEKVTHCEELCVARSEPCYNPLKMFYDIAERYFATSTPQDLENAIKEQRETNVIVHRDYIEHLREEIERLEDEVNILEAAKESLADEQVKILDERDEFHNENAKLKCLALHAMRDLFDYKGHKLNYEGKEIWKKYCHKYIELDKAYRKAKKKLMEGK